jgi:hypothetical protein
MWVFFDISQKEIDKAFKSCKDMKEEGIDIDEFDLISSPISKIKE